MDIFFSSDVSGNILRLSPEESKHCVKVLRRRSGDSIEVIDGSGTLYRCVITLDNPAGVEALISETIPDWGTHPYKLTMAVCPTKNSDRYEWFAEKATEFGVDCIVPVIGERSERRVFKTDRLRRVVLSAVKQSLKGAVPEVAEPVSVKEFIASCQASCKLIAYCFDDASTPRRSITEVLSGNDIAVLIGPEGDFSPEEARMAIAAGFVPIHLGESRLRTETAAIAAVAAVYFHHI